MNMRLLIGLLLFAPAAFAAGGARIFQLHLNQHRVFATFSQDLQEGTQLTATFPGGGTCPLFVSKIKGRNASLDTSTCPQEKNLTVGQILTPAAGDLEMSDSGPRPLGTAHDVTDLMFQPAKGTFSVAGTYKMGAPKYSASLTSSKIFDETDKDTTLALLAKYGFTDKMTGGLTLGNATHSDQVSYGPAAATLNGTTATLNSSGMTDMILEGNYRLLEQNQNGYTLDLGLAYSPKGGNATMANGSSNGNSYRGGDLIRAQIQGGQQRDLWQFSILGSYEQYGTSSTTDALTSAVTNTAAYSVLSVTGLAQYELTPMFFVRGLGGAQNTGGKNLSGANTIQYGSYMQTNFGVEGLAAIVPHRLAATLQIREYMQVNQSGSLTTIPLSGTRSDQQITAGLTGNF